MLNSLIKGGQLLGISSQKKPGEADHPDVDELYKVSNIDPKISIATVYRTVKLFEN